MNETLRRAVEFTNPNYYHILEFGVYKGQTIKQLRHSFPKNYCVFGFDSFLGFPEDWTGTTLKKGDLSVCGVVPQIQDVTIFKGWFKDTIPLYIKIAKPICLLHVDCDLYSSTKEVLYGLKDFIVPSTIIVFDEWYYNHKDIEENRQHEQKAFLEFAERYSLKYAVMEEVEEERKIIKIL